MLSDVGSLIVVKRPSELCSNPFLSIEIEREREKKTAVERNSERCDITALSISSLLLALSQLDNEVGVVSP